MPESLWARRRGELSAPLQRLLQDIAGVAPVFSSYEFTQRLPDFLKRYWQDRTELLRRAEDGTLEQNYTALLDRARQAIREAATLAPDQVMETVRSLADELDGDKLPYFAPGLVGDERRIVQAVHDLVNTLLHYKLAMVLDSSADRLVMVTSGSGAQGSLEMARSRFFGTPVPEAIHSYARLMEFKLQLEETRCRQELDAAGGTSKAPGAGGPMEPRGKQEPGHPGQGSPRSTDEGATRRAPLQHTPGEATAVERALSEADRTD